MHEKLVDFVMENKMTFTVFLQSLIRVFFDVIGKLIGAEGFDSFVTNYIYHLRESNFIISCHVIFSTGMIV